MKKISTLLLVLLTGITLQGCITSLHPLYTDKDLVFDARLLGTWITDDPAETWQLENLLDKDKTKFKSQFINKDTYLLTHTSKGGRSTFQFNLVKLGDHYFIDLYPGELKEQDKLLEDHYLPVHSYAKIRIDNNGFELSYLDTEVLYKLLSENRIKIKHESFDYYKVITASTDELQKFIIKFADNKDFFTAPIKFKRAK